MRGAWLVLLTIGCGFQSRAPGTPGTDGGAPGDGFDTRQLCASIAKGTPPFKVAACATPTTSSLDVSGTVSIDTTSGTSTPPGLTCAALAAGSEDVCAVIASSLTIEPGAVLSAHGARPLALIAHAIKIQGTIDVASHIAGSIVGAGSQLSGCSSGTLPAGAGGGRGGAAAEAGGDGGDEGSKPGTGGRGGGSFAIVSLQGGCGGTRGGDGSPATSDGGETSGGAGGGAVWISSDTAPLEIDDGAVINASGAAGKAGGTEGHGGAGGGAGGLIVLQAPTITLKSGAMVFANGGGGGGGAGVHHTKGGFTGGAAGTEATGPSSGGAGGTGGIDGSDTVPNPNAPSGGGGAGYPNTASGDPGATGGHGGGGGGGGAGAIRVVSSTDITGLNVSPPPISLQ